MPHIYKHKKSGWRITYRVYFSDRPPVAKERYAMKKADAQILLGDLDRLEQNSRKRQLTREEITAALGLKYITEAEATALGGRRITGDGWRELSRKAEDWFRSNCSPTTITNVHSKLARIVEHFSDITPADVRPEDVEKYIHTRKAGGIKPSTIRKEIVILRKVLDGAGDGNPARKVPLLKVTGERVPRPLYPDEIKAFLKALEGRRGYLDGNLKPMTLVYLYAGLRPSEVVRLKKTDINLEAEKIHVQGQTKTGTARSVDMHPVLKPLLQKTLKHKGPYIFGGEQPYHANSFGREVRKVIKEAKLRDINPYSLRHTFITYLLRAGADLRTTMDQAGHARMSTTTRYLHVVPVEDSPVKRIDFGENPVLDNSTT